MDSSASGDSTIVGLQVNGPTSSSSSASMTMSSSQHNNASILPSLMQHHHQPVSIPAPQNHSAAMTSLLGSIHQHHQQHHHQQQPSIQHQSVANNIVHNQTLSSLSSLGVADPTSAVSSALGAAAAGWAALAPPSVKRRAPTHACPVCGKHYVNEGSLRKHLAAHPETAHITSALRMWPCSICPAVFPHETGKTRLQGCQLKNFFLYERIHIDPLTAMFYMGEHIHHLKKCFFVLRPLKYIRPTIITDRFLNSTLILSSLYSPQVMWDII